MNTIPAFHTLLRALCLCCVVLRTASAGPADFIHGVMAVLSRAGCNRGVCHGNHSGKGGFKLSLRGQYPARDFDALTAEFLGRRVDRSDAHRSLVLLKSTGAVAHEGGQRFKRDSREYRILHRWIADGCPPDAGPVPELEGIELNPHESVLVEPRRDVQLAVRAYFSDGSVRDVTSLAVYEPVETNATVSHDGLARLEAPGEATVIVRYLHLQAPVRLTLVAARPGFRWPEVPENNFIDRHVFDKLRLLRIRPSELADDSEFVRRAYLDALGVLPTAREARAFVENPSTGKRARLIDTLVERPEFADSWALRWSDLLRNEEKTIDRKGVQIFHRWIRRSIESAKPLNELAAELIAARGSTYSSPPSNFYRAARDPTSRSESAAQIFLGIRLGCARCHNHPFERWTQEDYYGWASFFARVRYKVLENRRRDRNDRHEFNGEQIVWMAREGDVKDPRTGKPVAPRFLGTATAPSRGRDRLRVLAEWISSPDNGFFARAQVNRIWYHLMGRGIVDPIDDFRSTNPPSHPRLLDALAREFVARNFDLRHMVRIIMNSQTYQLSSTPNETNSDDGRNFSHASVRRLAAEQLLDAICQTTGVPARFNGYPEGTRAGQIAGVSAIRPRDRTPSFGDRFLKLFGKPRRLLSCECERSSETTMGQAFQFISGPLIRDVLENPENRLAQLASGRTPREIIEELYWSALSRPPDSEELAAMMAYLEQADDRRAALEDVLWALLNAKEFIFRR